MLLCNLTHLNLLLIQNEGFDSVHTQKIKTKVRIKPYLTYHIWARVFYNLYTL